MKKQNIFLIFIFLFFCSIIVFFSKFNVWLGRNDYGQLGDGTNFDKNLPTQTSEEDWICTSAGYRHSLAIKSNGTLWAWGLNTYGEIGNGTTINTNIPIQIGTANDWYYVSAHGNHSLAIKNDGTLWAWGYNYNGQLGNGSTLNSTVPIQI
jgi:alpha-tubulin suppressor-like RCC1 family protein